FGRRLRGVRSGPAVDGRTATGAGAGSRATLFAAEGGGPEVSHSNTLTVDVVTNYVNLALVARPASPRHLPQPRGSAASLRGRPEAVAGPSGFVTSYAQGCARGAELDFERRCRELMPALARSANGWTFHVAERSAPSVVSAWESAHAALVLLHLDPPAPAAELRAPHQARQRQD